MNENSLWGLSLQRSIVALCSLNVTPKARNNNKYPTNKETGLVRSYQRSSVSIFFVHFPMLSFVSKLMYRSNLYGTVTVRSRRWLVVYQDKLDNTTPTLWNAIDNDFDSDNDQWNCFPARKDVWNSQYSAKADWRLLTRRPKFTILKILIDFIMPFFHGWRTVTYNIYATNFLLGSVLTIEILAATPVTTDASKTGMTW